MFFKGSNIYKTPCESAKENSGFGFMDEADNVKQIDPRFYERGAGVIKELTTENNIADADTFGYYDDSKNDYRKTAWTNIKAKLKSYFDPYYNITGGEGYTKLPDGTLICWGRATFPSGSATRVLVITLPANFVGNYRVSLTPEANGSIITNMFAAKQNGDTDKQSGKFTATVNCSGSQYDTYVDWVAIGKWK